MSNIVPIRHNASPLQMARLGFLAILGLIILSALFSCFTTIPADSVGVLTRFGAFTGIVDPGLRFKLPLGIDIITVVPVQRQLKLEFGFATSGSTNPDQGSTNPELESSMVTGDLNMVTVEWVVQYRIDDPKGYLFDVLEPADTLRDASESAMREVVGDRTVDEVLTVGRQDVETESLLRMQQLSKKYGLGLTITQVQLKDVHPPQPVQASFNEVNQSQQEKQQAINVANGEYNKAVPKAKGEADRNISAADGYALRRVNEARGDAEKFQAQLTEYVKAPEVTRQRLYFEMMAEVLPQIEHKVLLDDKAGRLLPLLPFNLNDPGKK